MPRKQAQPPLPKVVAMLARYRAKLRRALLALRELTLETAAATPGVGKLEETLKWNEPAYVTTE